MTLNVSTPPARSRSGIDTISVATVSDRTAFLALASFLTVVTTLAGYRFGEPESLLPIVLRSMDASYLSNDFYVSWNTGFGYRFYFARLLAALATEETLPVVWFGLTLLSNFALAIFSGLLARALFNESAHAALVGAFLVLSASTFELGYTGQFGRVLLIPTTLVQPLIVAALWAAVRGRPFLCGLLAAGAAIIQPVLGPEGGMIALVLAAITVFTRGRGFAALAGGAAVFVLSIAGSVVPYAGSVSLTSPQFVALESIFRNPHHTTPSTFPPYDFLAATSFVVATGVLYLWWWRDERTPRALALGIGAILAGLVLFCIPGYLFVEVVPWRIVAVARPFRLLVMVKFLGLILLAGAVARALRPRNWSDAGVLLVAALSPLSLAVVCVLVELRDRLRVPVAALLVVTGLMLVLVARPDAIDVVRYVAFGTITVGLLATGTSRAALAATVALTLLAPLVLVRLSALTPAPLQRWGQALEPRFRLDDSRGPAIDVARWARLHTPPHAVFLTPPSMGIFRVMAERAIVVDFKSFSYHDQAMVEWRQRLLECYGEPPPGIGGFPAERAMEKNYRQIDDPWISRLAERYGVTHAVLYEETATSLPILFRGGPYKVVAVEPGR
jgi:hypothetical protein